MMELHRTTNTIMDRYQSDLDCRWYETGMEDLGISFPNQAYDRSHLPESLERNIDAMPPYPHANILGGEPNVSETAEPGPLTTVLLILAADAIVIGITYAVLKWLGVL